MYKKMIIGGAAAAALALSSAGFATAAGNHGTKSPQAGGSAAKVARTLTTGQYSCDGGYQKQVLNRINNQYSTFYEGSDFSVPGATAYVYGPKYGKDTLSITFSAEDQLRGSAASDYYDWIELEVLVDGNPVQPYGPSDSPLALTGAREYASNSAQFCTKVGKGKHKVSVRTRLVDNGNDDSLSGWIDDTVLRVERSE